MRDFKKLLKAAKSGLLFFIILIVILAGLSEWMLFVSKRNDHLVRERNKNVVGIQREPENTIDAVILGDSLSYSAFSPMQMWEEEGIAAYVCGQPGQKIQETYYMLRTVLKSQKPKVVILEANTLFRRQEGISGIQKAVVEEAYYRLPVFRYHDMWKLLVTENSYKEKTYKGFVMRKDITPYKGREYMSKNRKNKTIPKMTQYYMGKIIRLCRENDMEFLIVSSPSPRNYDRSTARVLQEYAEKNSLRYLEMNLMIEEMGIDWSEDSRDKGDHLNLSGAGKATRVLGGCLKTEYHLPDHRRQKRYEAWDRELEEYEKVKRDATVGYEERQ